MRVYTSRKRCPNRLLFCEGRREPSRRPMILRLDKLRGLDASRLLHPTRVLVGVAEEMLPEN